MKANGGPLRSGDSVHLGHVGRNRALVRSQVHTHPLILASTHYRTVMPQPPTPSANRPRASVTESRRRRACLPLLWNSIALLATLYLSDPAEAQVVATSVLKPADANLSFGFMYLWAVRELRDGRVLISSGTPESRLVVADFRSDGVLALGREGSGPGEYRAARDIWPLPGDSSLVDAWGQRRWLILSGARIANTVSSWGAGLGGARIAGIDSAGHLLEIRPIRFGKSGNELVLQLPQNAESLLVLRHDRSARNPDTRSEARVDTLASLRGPWSGIRWLKRASELNRAVEYELHGPLDSEDQAVLFPDGWLAIARVSPYRVEWRQPDGIWIRGRPLPFAPARVDDAEKRRALLATYERFTRGNLFTAEDYPPWPATTPPFLREAVFPGPNGQIAIRRYSPSGSTRPIYDLVDRTGALSSRVEISLNQRIVAFGSASVYLVERGSDEVERLRRHPWP